MGLDESPGEDWILADDNLDAPLGKGKKRKQLKSPVVLPQVAAGLLGLSIVVVAGWTVLASNPYGGQPVAVVAMGTGGGKDAKAAPAPNAATPGAHAETAVPPGSKVVTITDGSTGKAQQVVVPPKPDSELQKKAPVDPQLLEQSRHGQIPKIAANGRRAALAYAKPVDLPAGKADTPRVAIVVAGLGISASATADAMEQLPAPVTLAFAPYGANLDNLAADARARNHEILLQVPMEPFDYPDNDPGPQTLLTSLSSAQNLDRLQWLMARMQGYVGVASLMGSRFNASDAALSPILREVAKRGLIYVDDGSSSRSVAGQIAGANNLPFAKADVVLDKMPAPAEIDHALARLELAAREHGSAVGFANASPATIERIAHWAKNLNGRGIVLVPISMVTVKPKSS
jgi:polysaccharide deacetylase 2 family uncharacterized protein YibQ